MQKGNVGSELIRRTLGEGSQVSWNGRLYQSFRIRREDKRSKLPLRVDWFLALPTTTALIDILRAPFSP